MADINLAQGQSLDSAVLVKYQDQGDGTHALVVAGGAVAAGVDITDRAARLLGRTTNYDVTVNGTLNALNTVVTLTGVQGLGSAGVAISGTWVGTIIAEGQGGDGVWNTIPMVVATSGQGGLSTTVNGNFIIGVAGYLNVRMRRNVFTNGTATVYIRGTRAVNGMFLTRSIPTGLNTIGSILVTDQIPGVGATNLGKADGALYAAGHTGVAAMGVRNDTDAVMPAVDGAYGPLTVDDTGKLRAAVSTYGTSISQTPTVTAAGAYTANDAVGGLLTFAGAARMTGGGGVIKDIIILDDNGQDAEMELWLFNATFTAEADNAPWSPSEADLRKLIAIISTSDGAWFAAGTPSAARVEAAQRYDLAGTSLFGQLVTRGTPTFAATDDVTAIVGLLQD